MVRRKLGEHDIDITVLYILNTQGAMDMSTLKSHVFSMLNPRGANLDALLHRNDSKIDQIIRNIVSHRGNEDNLVYEGFVRYNPSNGMLSITQNGRLYLDSFLVHGIVESLE